MRRTVMAGSKSCSSFLFQLRNRGMVLVQHRIVNIAAPHVIQWIQDSTITTEEQMEQSARQQKNRIPSPTGIRLTQLRSQAGLTQRELARRLHIAHTTISKWEDTSIQGSRIPADTIPLLAKQLGVSPCDFFATEEVSTTVLVANAMENGFARLPADQQSILETWYQIHRPRTGGVEVDPSAR